MDLYEKILQALERYSKGSMLENVYGLSETAAPFTCKNGFPRNIF